jgi:hypothetical protein
MSFAGASLAKTSVELDAAPEYPEPVQDCFGNWCEPFAWFDPASQSWRTWQTCLVTEWTPFAGPWPKAGMTRSGIAFRRTPSVHRSSVTVSGLLPTPTSGSGRQGGHQPFDGGSQARAKARAIGLIPTPTVKGNYNRVGTSATLGDGLFTVAREAMPGRRIGPTPLTRFVEWLMGYPVDWSKPKD